uniref:Uncharacterized protein n=1 Tax=uncultured prokaryote TaxID=198431 RepID=A0A0H5Q629_9ZZZZ|nr:hypothetical protein [uncultured prokaryote]
MVNLREMIVDITGPQGSGMVNVHYFESTGDAAAQMAALQSLYSDMDVYIADLYSFSIRGSGKVLDEITGDLVDFWTEGAALVVPGTGSAEPVADATQLLFRWETGTIVNNRVVKGHTYVPGFTVNNLLNGNMTTTSTSTLSGVAVAFAGTAGHGIWSRPRAANPSADPPVTARDGTFAPATSGSVWNELAVLRGRRG